MKLRNKKEYSVIDRVVVQNKEFKSSTIKIHKNTSKRVSVPKEKRAEIRKKELTVKLTRINPGNVKNIIWIDVLKKIEQKDQQKAANLRRELKKAIMTDHVKHVEELVLDGHMSENWRRFKRNYKIFEKAAKVDTENDEIKIATFLNAIGPGAVDLYDSFTMTDAQRAVYDTVIGAFETYCNPRKNVIYERYKFNQRNQKDGESFDEFLLAIKLLSRYCEFERSESQLMRDRIVAGIVDNKLRRQLLATPDLTLDTCIQKARTSEATQKQSETMSKTVTKTAVVDVVQTQQQHKQYRSVKKSNHSNSQKRNSNGSSNDKRHTNTDDDESETNNNNNNNNGNKSKHRDECTFCGGQHGPRNCPAYGKTCHKCNLRNHFSSVCRTVACLSVNDDNQSEESDCCF